MAYEPLATDADLSARGISTENVAATAALLDAASAAVREAAGCPISEQTSTVTLWTEASRRIELPARPVRSVASVVLDGETLTVDDDYVVRGSSLWRDCQWQAQGDIPGELVVTFTHGYAEVPADIVDLVCNLVGAGMASVTEGYASHAGKQYESIDDYRVGYTVGPDAISSVMELPERTVRSLRARFGTTTVVVGTVR